MRRFAIALLAGSLVPIAAFAQSASGPASPAREQPEELVELDYEQFTHKAASGNLAEVAMGELAQERGSRPEVKEFGQRMIEDHSRANEALTAVAEKKGITTPTEPGPEERETMQRLSALNGEEFDRQYARLMVEDHRKDVAMYRAMAESSEDADLKKYASDTLPVLQEHLTLAESMAQEMAVMPEEASGQPR